MDAVILSKNDDRGLSMSCPLIPAKSLIYATVQEEGATESRYREPHNKQIDFARKLNNY
jgi:hypothetical protein